MAGPRKGKRKRSDKRQTKLTFSPVPATSATAAGNDGSPPRPNKRARIRSPDKESDSANDNPRQASRPSLSTPNTSFQAPTPRKSARTFSSSASEYSPPRPSLGMFGRSSSQRALTSQEESSDSSSVDESQLAYPLPRKRKKGDKRKKDKKSGEEQSKSAADPLKNINEADSKDDSDDLPPLRVRRATQPIVVDDDSDNDSEELPRSAKKRRSVKTLESGLDSSSTTAAEHLSHRKGRRLVRRRTRKASTSDEGDDSHNEAPTRRVERISLSSEESDDEEEEEVEEPVKTPKRHGPLVKKPHPVNDQEREDLEQDLEWLKSSPSPLAKDRWRQVPQKVTRANALEEYKRRRLQKEGPSSPVAPGQVKRSSRIVILSDDEDDQEAHRDKGKGKAIAVESNSDAMDDIDEETNETEGSEEDEDADSPHTRSAAYGMFSADKDDQDFIDDDNDTPVDLAALADIPIALSRFSHGKSKDFFRLAVEWMVHRRLNPAFSMEDDLYTHSFNKLDKEVQGLAGSKFTSSVWTVDFSRALHARPVIEITEIPRVEKELMPPGCDACNRKSHPCSFYISFSGKPYDRISLELLKEVQSSDSDSSDSEESSSNSSSSQSESDSAMAGSSVTQGIKEKKAKEEEEEEKGERNENGDVIPPTSRRFNVGSHCKGNAETAHALHHWRFHLNEMVLEYLESENYMTPDEILKRDSLSMKKRSKYADKVVDKMMKGGVIDRLHKQYREQLNYAVNVKNEWRGFRGRK